MTQSAVLGDACSWSVTGPVETGSTVEGEPIRRVVTMVQCKDQAIQVMTYQISRTVVVMREDMMHAQSLTDQVFCHVLQNIAG